MADGNVVTLRIKLENGQWVSAAQETAKATDAIGKGAEEAGKKASNGLGKLGPLLAQIAKDLSGLRAASGV